MKLLKSGRVQVTRTLKKENWKKLREKAFILEKDESEILDDLLGRYL